METTKLETILGHPYTSALATVFLLRWTLTTFEPNSPARPYLAAGCLATCLATIATAHKATPYTFLNTFASFAFGGQLALDVVDHVLYSKRYYPDEKRRLGKTDRRATSEIMWFIDVFYNRRKIGTPAQIRNIPQFDPKDPSYVPSRGWFLIAKTIRLAMSLVIIELMANPTHADAAVRYGGNREEMFHLIFQGKFSAQDFMDRVVDIGRFWINAYFTQGLFFDFYAIIMVGLGLNSVESWPPRFGPVSETYTLRRYWGIFWHQDLRTSLLANANYISDRILRLPKKSSFTIWFKTGITFFLSGTLHWITDLVTGIPPTECGSLTFFTIQTFGFWLEDMGLSIYRLVKKAVSDKGGKVAEKDAKPEAKEVKEVKEVKKKSPPALWQKAVGYIWILLWLTWATPFMTFPHWRHGAEELLPAHAESWQKAEYMS